MLKTKLSACNAQHMRAVSAPKRNCLFGSLARSRCRSLSSISREYTCSAANEASTSSQETFTITTPLYYVNAVPHMGSAYPTIAADVIARYQRLKGKHVRFLTGTDEHGEKIAAAAARRGLTPQAHCDDVAAAYTALWDQLDISYDAFVRTTNARHEALVKSVLEAVWSAGDVYMADYEGWYCVDCEEFKDEKELGDGHVCTTHRAPCQHRKEGNYFFRLSTYQQQLEQLITANDASMVYPPARRNEVAGWVKEGARDFSISRSKVDWGIRFPQDPQHTVYVWFDALIGYLSGLLPAEAEPSIANITQYGWPADVHVIGKDILRFHAIYWPGMLMSLGLPAPKRIFGHGFLTKDGLKMGKALGNVLDPVALVSAYGSDAVRFYFMKEVVFGQDGDFSEQRFRDSVNAALANTIGNMLNRSLNLLAKNCASTLPIDSLAALDACPGARAVQESAEQAVSGAALAYDEMRIHDALELIVGASVKGNQLLEEVQPWSLLKKGTPEQKESAAACLVVVLELMRIIAVALTPTTPSLASRIFRQLGFTAESLQDIRWTDTVWGGLKKGHQMSAPEPVFGRLEGVWVTEPAPEPEVAVKVKATKSK